MDNPKGKNDPEIRELASVGKYRVRLISDPAHPDRDPVLDIREYVESDVFSGFTRRGIRLTDRAQIDHLRDILRMILEQHGWKK